MESIQSRPKRRWLRFSLRTLFVLVTLFCCWLGYQLNWIRQRHEVLKSGRLELVFTRTAHAPRGRSQPAPGLLWALGEPGYIGLYLKRLNAVPRQQEILEVEQIQRLFPEAQVGYLKLQRYDRPFP